MRRGTHRKRAFTTRSSLTGSEFSEDNSSVGSEDNGSFYTEPRKADHKRLKTRTQNALSAQEVLPAIKKRERIDTQQDPASNVLLSTEYSDVEQYNGTPLIEKPRHTTRLHSINSIDSLTSGVPTLNSVLVGGRARIPPSSPLALKRPRLSSLLVDSNTNENTTERIACGKKQSEYPTETMTSQHRKRLRQWEEGDTVQLVAATSKEGPLAAFNNSQPQASSSVLQPTQFNIDSQGDIVSEEDDDNQVPALGLSHSPVSQNATAIQTRLSQSGSGWTRQLLSAPRGLTVVDSELKERPASSAQSSRTKRSIADFFNPFHLQRRRKEISMQEGFQRRNVRMFQEEELGLRTVADSVYGWLNPDWTGCGESYHNERLQAHYDDMEDNDYSHGDLSTTYSEEVFPYDHTDVGLHIQGFPGKTGQPRETYADSFDIKRLMEGRQDDSQKPIAVCLHCENPSDSTPYVSWGTDSVVMLGKSLAMFRTNFKLCVVYTVDRNISETLHLPIRLESIVGRETMDIINSQLWEEKDAEDKEINPQYSDGEGDSTPSTQRKKRSKRSRSIFYFRDIPHIYIGFCAAYPESPVLIAWPRLTRGRGRSDNYIQKEILSQFYRRVLRPALKSCLSPESFANLPPTQSSADTRATAAARESGNGTSLKKQMHHSPLPSDTLGPLWERMKILIEGSEDLHHFKDMFLCLDVKNIKGELERENLFEAMEAFDEKIERDFDETFIPSMAIDLAVSICARNGQGSYRGYASFTPVTYFWRDCCVEHFFEELRRIHFSGTVGSPRFYTVAHLKDTKCLTIEPPRRSDLWKYGVRYIQMYNAVKGLLEAMGHWPFDKDDLLQLAVDGDVFRRVLQILKKRDQDTYERLKRKWHHNKSRADQELDCEELSSKPARFEVRLMREQELVKNEDPSGNTIGSDDISFDEEELDGDRELADAENTKNEQSPGSDQKHGQAMKGTWWAIKERAYNAWRDDKDGARLEDVPDTLHAVDTSSYMAFLRGNLHKYVSLVEICAITSPPRRTLERTMLMHVLLLTLRNFLNSVIEQQPVLAKSIVDTVEGTKFGLGFANSCAKYGYCWWMSIVNWEHLRFKDNIGDHLLGRVQQQLLPGYQSVPDLIKERDLSLGTQRIYLRKSVGSPEMRNTLWKIMAHTLFKEYRMEIWRTLKNVRKNRLEDAKNDAIRFCDREFRNVLSENVGYHQRANVKFGDPVHIFNLLWTDCKQFNGIVYNRDHMESLAFRDLLRLHQRQIQPEYLEEYRDVLRADFFRYHPVIPYPNPSRGSLTIWDGKGDKARRLLYATRQGKTKRDVVWAVNKPSNDSPEPYPIFVGWTEEKKRELLDLYDWGKK